MTNKLVLSGDLIFLSLGDVLQMIGSNGSTGALHIAGKYSPEPGVIYFYKGNIINASAPSLKGLDAAYTLFGWTEGTFEFYEGPIKVKKNISSSRMEIILDGLRMVDDGEVEKLGPVSFDKKTSNIPIIKGPLPDYLYILDEEDFQSGRIIVQENKFGNWIWVIMEGVVDIIKETPQNPLTLIKLGAGTYIGSLSSFSFEGNIWPITAQASTDVQLGVIDVQKLSEEIEFRSNDFRDFVVSLNHRRTQIYEKTVQIYLKQDDVREFTKGKKRIIKQGKEEDSLLKITQGQAFIVRKTPVGYIPAAVLKTGDFIGSVPFLNIGHEPQKASVFVSEDFESISVKASTLQKEYETVSYTLKNFIESVATNISVTTRVACDFQKKYARKKSKRQRS